jgi:hypothetical protein
MINISAAMGGQFAWSAAEFTEEIRQLGQNPLKESIPEEKEKTKEEVIE